MSSAVNIPTPRRTPKAAEDSPSGSYSTSPSTSTSTPSSSPKSNPFHTRRPSLLSSALAKQESTVINIGEPDGPPRLVGDGCGSKSPQGFAWNPEIFLPSYVDCDYVPLENRRDPVHEIHLTEEETRAMLPQ